MQGKGRSLANSSLLVASSGALNASAVMEAAAWYAIWTRSHCEQFVSDQLSGKGFAVFLPKASVWSTRRGVRRQNEVPLFPGYLFVHHAIDKHSHTDIIKARGVVRVLGERWDRLATIDDVTITGLRRLVDSGLPIEVQSRLHTGARVRVTGGPFAGLKGIFVRERTARGLFVVSIDLLQRSVAVEIECSQVEAL